jgi:putative transposase
MIKGRKRQIVVDTFGFLLRVVVHPANVQDRAGARLVLEQLPPHPRLNEIRVDAGYTSEPLAAWCQETLHAVLSVTKRDPNTKGFVVQKGRWVVERTFAWLGRYRRLSKDYEGKPEISEGVVYLAAIHFLLRRIARNLS